MTYLLRWVGLLAVFLLPLDAVKAEAEGIDVSHHNGAIDWSTAKSGGIGFAYVKASEGLDDPDPLFGSNWSSLGEQGIPRGAYHFFITEDDPHEQAKLFLSVYKPQSGDLLPAIDIEVLAKGSDSAAPQKLSTFIELVRSAAGASPIIYTNAHFWDTEMASNPELLKAIKDCPLWIAEYGVTAPKIPDGWTRWTIWQWEPSGALAGITGDVDRDRLHQDLSITDITILIQKNQ